MSIGVSNDSVNLNGTGNGGASNGLHIGSSDSLPSLPTALVGGALSPSSNSSSSGSSLHFQPQPIPSSNSSRAVGSAPSLVATSPVSSSVGGSGGGVGGGGSGGSGGIGSGDDEKLSSISSPPQQTNVPTKLFIGQVPKNFAEEALRKIFEPFGVIQELIVLRDRQTGAHRGCAFLTYATKSSADKAISAIHEKMTLHQRPIQVRYAGDKDQNKEWKLFVGMLNKSSEQEHVRQLFSQFGIVKEVHIIHDSYTNQSKGCAFVKLTSKEDAEAAIKALHENYQDTGAPRKLIVKFADTASEKQAKQQQLLSAHQLPHTHSPVVGMGVGLHPNLSPHISPHISPSGPLTYQHQLPHTALQYQHTVTVASPSPPQPLPLQLHTAPQPSAHHSPQHSPQQQSYAYATFTQPAVQTNVQPTIVPVVQRSPFVTGQTSSSFGVSQSHYGRSGYQPSPHSPQPNTAFNHAYGNQFARPSTNQPIHIQPAQYNSNPAARSPYSPQPSPPSQTTSSMASSSQSPSPAQLSMSPSQMNIRSPSGVLTAPPHMPLDSTSPIGSHPVTLTMNSIQPNKPAALSSHNQPSIEHAQQPGYGYHTNNFDHSHSAPPTPAQPTPQQMSTPQLSKQPEGSSPTPLTATDLATSMAQMSLNSKQQIPIASNPSLGSIPVNPNLSNNPDQRGPDGSNLFIYNVPDVFNDLDLAGVCAPYGTLLAAGVFRDKISGTPKGIGFANFTDPESADKAINALNGATFHGKKLRVMLKATPPPGPIPGANTNNHTHHSHLAATAATTTTVNAVNTSPITLTPQTLHLQQPSHLATSNAASSNAHHSMQPNTTMVPTTMTTMVPVVPVSAMTMSAMPTAFVNVGYPQMQPRYY